jgi:hypothetical protein
MRRCRAVAKLGPGTLQLSWTGHVTAALNDAHTEVVAANARGDAALDPRRLAELRDRYDKAVQTGIIHNRHRDWDSDGNHPAFTLATWLHTYAEQVWHSPPTSTSTGPPTPPNAASNPPNDIEPSPPPHRWP